MSEKTKGQTLATLLRAEREVGTRARDRRDGGSIKADMLEALSNATLYPGYYTGARHDAYSGAWGALNSYRKHVDGYRIDPILRRHITEMSPWKFAGLLGEMVDAGVTCTGEGEQFFAAMARKMTR